MEFLTSAISPITGLILNLLMAIYFVLNSIHLPYTLGFSIIVLTIIIRALLYPLIGKQLKASKKMQDLNPHISNIKDKHKGNNKMIQSETQRLYKEHGVNPLAGCLPTLVQLPIIWGLYTVLNEIVKKGPLEAMAYVNHIVAEPLHLTQPWNTTFFGIPLGQSPQQLFSEGSKEGIAMLVIIAIAVPVVTGLFQFIQSKMIAPAPSNVPAVKGKKKNDDFATAFQTQSTYIFPVMIGIFSFTLPFGLSLYWNTFSIFGIIQQYRIVGLGGLESLWLKIQPKLKK